jgi:glyoxylase-like metal-dependent hydrolase (beta-lactamase superfamily II)
VTALPTHPFATPPAEGQATEVAPDVWWMRLPLPMALDHVNVYALRDADGWTLIDTGFHSARGVALWQALLDGPLAGRPVVRVLVTHHHPDHVGMAGWFQARGAELWMTRTAWLYARMLTLDVQTVPGPQAMTFLARAGLDAPALAVQATKRPFNFADIVAPMPLGFTLLAEGQVLTLAGRRWQVRLGSGHAPDHATLWSQDDGLVLGGDQMLPGISAIIGVYPTEPEADPLRDWLDSCRRFHPLARPDQLVLPGHKLPFLGLPDRLSTMISEHETALDKLIDHLAQPRRATDVFDALFKRPIGPAERDMAIAESIAHLNHLWKAGRIRRWREGEAYLWQIA